MFDILWASTYTLKSYNILNLGDWICLEIDPALLKSGADSVIYEAPAPVGTKESYTKDSPEENVLKFPHIYGGINVSSVTKRYRISRSEDGSFLNIEGL